MDTLLDQRGRAKVAECIRRIKGGNFGDHKPVGGGISELRIHGAGPGYRVYFAFIGAAVVILLCGGDKDSQQRDIARAQNLREEI